MIITIILLIILLGVTADVVIDGKIFNKSEEVLDDSKSKIENTQKDIEEIKKDWERSVVIVNPNLEEESVKSLINKFSDLINTDGKVDSVEELGKKKLAYEIKKQKEAYYLIFKFEANPELISELERNYRITDEVIKFIVVKEEE